MCECEVVWSIVLCGLNSQVVQLLDCRMRFLVLECVQKYVLQMYWMYAVFVCTSFLLLTSFGLSQDRNRAWSHYRLAAGMGSTFWICFFPCLLCVLYFVSLSQPNSCVGRWCMWCALWVHSGSQPSSCVGRWCTWCALYSTEANQESLLTMSRWFSGDEVDHTSTVDTDQSKRYTNHKWQDSNA